MSEQKPWYKRIFRWDKPAIRYIIAGFLALYLLASYHEARAESPYLTVTAGVSKFHAPVQAFNMWLADRRLMIGVDRIGTEDRGSFKTRPVMTIRAMRWAGWGERHRLELGLGGSFSHATTVTQGSKLNFALGIGYAYVRDSWFVSLHEIHDSNAGLVRPNSGRDALQLSFGTRL